MPVVAGTDLQSGLYRERSFVIPPRLRQNAVNASGYRAPNAQVRANSGLLLMARELGDTTVADKLKAAADRESDPRFFGKQNEMFGWWTTFTTASMMCQPTCLRNDEYHA